jgi:hypothetical protein
MIIKMNKTSLVMAFFVAAVLTGLFIRFGTRESFAQKEVGMPLNSPGIGPFDGVSQGGGVSGWAATEATPVLASNLGAAPLPSAADNSNDFMLMVGNRVDSSCCPSAYNTDTGCVCLTEADKDLFAHRGGNRA